MLRENFGIYPSSLWDNVFRRIKDFLSRKNVLISQCAVYDEYKTFLKFFTGLELKEVKNKQIYARGFHSIAEVKKVTTEHRNSLAVHWLRLGAFTAAGPVRTLAGELISRKLRGEAKRNQTKIKRTLQNSYAD